MNYSFPLITVSGPDEKTDLKALAKLNCEVGILYTATPEGRNRYPSFDWIVEAVKVLPRPAIHICGGIARGELSGRKLSAIIDKAFRIQVNGTPTIEDVERYCRMFPHKRIITQHKPANECLLAVKASNHMVLLDGSGGRGISPTSWRIADRRGKSFGFAGGLGPENLRAELKNIEPHALGQWWVDMEGKLRVDDWFSVERAKRAVDIFNLVARGEHDHDGHASPFEPGYPYN